MLSVNLTYNIINSQMSESDDMKTSTQNKSLDFIESIIYRILKGGAYTLLAIAGIYLAVALYIGMRELPSRIEYAKNQYWEYQELKEKIQVTPINE